MRANKLRSFLKGLKIKMEILFLVLKKQEELSPGRKLKKHLKNKKKYPVLLKTQLKVV